MISFESTVDDAPWAEVPAWPFDDKSWSERSTTTWNDGICEVCNALDSDSPIESCWPSEMPKIQQLYVLASLMLMFLENMPDGIVTEELWTQLDDHFTHSEKSKRKPTTEEQRTAIQEILSQSPSHSISFILITTMLERIMQEVMGVSKTGNNAPLSPTRQKPMSPLRRVTGSLGKLPDTPYLERGSEAFAQIFGRVMIRPLASAGSKKTSAAQERKKAELVALFLRKDPL